MMPAVVRRLRVSDIPRRVLHGAVAGIRVRQSQEALRDAGFDPGEIDGVYGYRTATAVRDYQRARGLTPDGVVGGETWQALTREPGQERLAGKSLRDTLHGRKAAPTYAWRRRRLGGPGSTPAPSTACTAP
jgi:peptidoglycan hydrolase-like protein with peptidoglycan-binding domain